MTLVIPWTVVWQAPLSMGFSRQEYRSGLPFPSPGDLPDPGIEPESPELLVDSSLTEPPGESPPPPKNLNRETSNKIRIFKRQIDMLL